MAKVDALAILNKAHSSSLEHPLKAFKRASGSKEESWRNHDYN
ncbi:MAG: hypothetical protein WDA17_02705 [Sphaerochaetaceae bacterium]